MCFYCWAKLTDHFLLLPTCMHNGWLPDSQDSCFPHVTDRCSHKNSTRSTSPIKKKKKVSVYKTSQTIHISEYACIGTKQYGEVSKAHT